MQTPEPVHLIALGGLGEVGMNCMAIECCDHRLLVDCGVTFPDDPFGADVIRPDFRYLSQQPKAHQALWLTHGHEDHIGAVAYLLREHPMVVYGPPYALALVRERLQQVPPDRAPTLTPVVPRERVRFGPFTAEAIRVTHSIADATSLALDTPAGLIVHTADFKIDPVPTDHEYFDEPRFRELGDQGVRLLLSDSTNVDSPGHTGSESEVQESLIQLVEQAAGRVMVTLFASNTHRLRAVLTAAKASGRRLCLLGRSVQTHARVAQLLGHVRRADEVLVSPQEAAALARSEVLFAATGSQAEAASALSRIAARTHPLIALESGDTVILSSRIIPGNDRRVLELIDNLLKQGIEVVERRTQRDVHVSGHAHRDEQRAMIDLVRPEAFVPVHGTYHHLLRHAEIARAQGVPDVVVAQNGDLLELTPEALRIAGQVPTGRVFLARGEPIEAHVLEERARLARTGTIVVSVALDQQGRQLGAAEFQAMGHALPTDQEPWLAQARAVVVRTLRHVNEGDLRDLDGLRSTLRRRLGRFFFDTLGDRVVCIPQVLVLRH